MPRICHVQYVRKQRAESGLIFNPGSRDFLFDLKLRISFYRFSFEILVILNWLRQVITIIKQIPSVGVGLF